jgi:RNA polymerase sigma factor (sigma-70 family)
MKVSDTDLQLLARYTRQHAEDVFAEIVRRHVDLVFTAALRQVRSPQLAEEVAQLVFIDLAKQSNRLAPETILTAWLYQVTRRTAIDVVRREVRRQHRERVASELSAVNAAPANDWTHIEPLLDEAMDALDGTDRTAVLLRYFEDKSFLEVGQALGTNEDAARKRVGRAVEQLREFFGKRGVAVGAGAQTAAVSANAVQAAPAGLAASISAAAVVAGTTVATAATAAVTKAIAMTAVQKTLVALTLTVAIGTGIYGVHQAAQAREQIQTFRQQQASQAEQIRQLQRERDNVINQLPGAHAENERLKSNQTELVRLRDEAAMLRQQIDTLAALTQTGDRAGKQKPRAFSTNVVSRESFEFAGYATPEDTIQSMLWAKSVGNVHKFLESAEPEESNALVRSYLDMLSRSSESEEDQSKQLVAESENMTGFQILNDYPLADDLAMIQVSLQEQAGDGALQQGDVMVLLKQANGEWKYRVEYNSTDYSSPATRFVPH